MTNDKEISRIIKHYKGLVTRLQAICNRVTNGL